MESSVNGSSHPIPYSQEAEEATIGAVLVTPTIFPALITTLKPDDFFILRHRYIWQALDRLHTRGDAIDYLTLSAELKAMDKLAEIGGAAYLTALINATPTSLHAGMYGQMVERAATRRRLMALADEIKASALDENQTVEQIVLDADVKLRDVEGDKQHPELKSMNTVMNAVLDRYVTRLEQRASDHNPLAGISSGIDPLDRITNGFQPTQLILIAGRPGMGKTAKMTYMATHCAQSPCKPNGQPYRVLFVTLEMTIEQLGRRMLSAASGVPGVDILKAQLSPGQTKAMYDKAGELNDLQIWMYDGLPPHASVMEQRKKIETVMTPRKLRRLIFQFAQQFKALPDEVFVDYIQLVHSDTRINNRVEELSNVSRGIKEIAREFHLPIISGAQLSRAVDDRQDHRPVLGDLRESGSLEQDSDVVIFPFCDFYYTDPNTKAGSSEDIVAKNRDGSTGIAKNIWVDFATMQYSEMDMPF